MFDPMLIGGELQPVGLTLYTDAFMIRGTIRTRQRRLTDILNLAEDPFLVISDAVTDEYGSHGFVAKTEYAQVNLHAVLFAIAEGSIETRPDLRTPKVPEMALISIPPFKITGRIHLLPERDLQVALSELTGEFIPVTDATFWSDSIGEARSTAEMIAFNHNRAQILAPHTAVDPWSGLDRSGEAASSAGLGQAPEQRPAPDEGGRPAGGPSGTDPGWG